MKQIYSFKKTLLIGLCCLTVISLMLILTSCDERGGEKPRMVISVENNQLYGAGVACNLNHTQITFILDGSPGFINDMKILVDYDKLRGLFVGSGSDEFVRTNSDGIAVGTFQANPTAYGVTPITARIDRFRDVKETVTLYLYDIPEITLTTEETYVTVGEDTNISVQLTDNANNRADIGIVFTTNNGLLAFPNLRTDNNGRVSNVFQAGETPGTARVRAALQICPSTYKEIVINIVE